MGVPVPVCSMPSGALAGLIARAWWALGEQSRPAVPRMVRSVLRRPALL